MSNIAQLTALQGGTILNAGCFIQNQLASISFGKFCIIDSQSIIQPPHDTFKTFIDPDYSNTSSFLPMEFGDYIYIGKHSIIQALRVGSNVIIEDHCIIGERCIISDGCIVEKGTIIPQNTVVPPHSVVNATTLTRQWKMMDSIVNGLEVRPLHNKQFVMDKYNFFMQCLNEDVL